MTYVAAMRTAWDSEWSMVRLLDGLEPFILWSSMRCSAISFPSLLFYQRSVLNTLIIVVIKNIQAYICPLVHNLIGQLCELRNVICQFQLGDDA